MSYLAYKNSIFSKILNKRNFYSILNIKLAQILIIEKQ